jgi:predicted ATP-dependent endonuclease of OLD family
LFYIISEVCYDDFDSTIKSSNLGFTIKEAAFANRIILIEEPELGIHPHQFDKLLNILREESETKQIIITSHSPQVLNKLDSSELDRIIIAYTTNDKKGTQLRHLNRDELIKAKQYIEDDFLSDYWLHSDLEKSDI